MNTRLTHIAIEGFTSIGRRAEIDLGPLTALVGPNGAGKSNLLLFFRLLNYMMSGSLQSFVGRFGGANSLLHFGAKRTQTFSGEIAFETAEGINTYGFQLTHARPDRLIFANETIEFQRGDDARNAEPVVLATGHAESTLLNPENRSRSECQAFARCLSSFRFFQFNDTSDISPLRSRTRASANSYLRADGGNLAAMLLKLRDHHPHEYSMLLKTVRLVAPFLEDFVFFPEGGAADEGTSRVAEEDPSADTWLLLRWRMKDPNYEFGVHQLSDGTLRFIALATLLLLPAPLQPLAIFIDEPELGLHPKALAVLAGLLRTASSGTQIICSTQSPTLLDHFSEEEVLVVERDDGNTVFRRLDAAMLETWKADYSLGDMWKMNLLGGEAQP